MPTFSLEELKRLIRKTEFNKTEHELLIELVNKAMKAGEGERSRLKYINQKSRRLFEALKDINFFHQIKINEDLIDNFREVPIGAIDGSFQVVGGVGGKWYAVYGISQVIAQRGFTLQPIIKVGGNIESLEAVDEREANQKAGILMMLGEIKSFREVTEKIGSKEDFYLLIDGPLIDPPLCMDVKYIESRVNALRYCWERRGSAVGFVKRVAGSNLLNFLGSKIGKRQVEDFTNDLDLLSTIMYNAVKETSCGVFTYPISYNINTKKGLSLPYRYYRERGLIIYYSYYKPSLRGRVFRIEYASFKELSGKELLRRFQKIMGLINKVWTMPGMEEPLPIIMAHIKCNVRRGAAETLYYEIIARALGEGIPHLWLEAT